MQATQCLVTSKHNICHIFCFNELIDSNKNVHASKTNFIIKVLPVTLSSTTLYNFMQPNNPPKYDENRIVNFSFTEKFVIRYSIKIKVHYHKAFLDLYSVSSNRRVFTNKIPR